MPPRLRAPLFLLALSLLIAAARLHTYHEPLERDITTYAVIGQGWNAGRPLYSDLWDHKPPAIHLTYALASRLAGRGPAAVYLLGVSAAIVTLLGIYAAALGLTRDPHAALAAAAIWAVIASDLRLQANQPNTEVFLNACAVWGIAALLAARGRRGMILVAGALFALASLYKPNAAVVGAALAVAHVVASDRGRRREALIDFALIAGVGALFWALLIAGFAAAGSLGAMHEAVFAYNRAYAADLVWNLARGLHPRHLFPASMLAVAPLAAVALVTFAVTAARRRRPGHGGSLLIAYAVATYVAVALPGHFYPHYYQLWLPVWALTAGVAVADLRGRAPRSERAFFATAALFVTLLALQAPSYRLSADDWSRQKYGDIFIQTREAARYIDTLLTRNETFYELGSETGLYLESRRSPPAGVFYALPLLDGPLQESLTSRVLADLEQAPPELFVVEKSTRQDPDHPLVRWYRQRYRLWRGAGGDERFLYFVRRSGRLDRSRAEGTATP